MGDDTLVSRYAEAVGRRSEPLVYDVERGHIARFAAAIGDTTAAYTDEAAAEALGHPTVIAPPTFAIALRPNDARLGLDIDWKKLLHAEQEIALERPLYAGDRITVTSEIESAVAKAGKSGVTDFLTTRTEGHDAEGELVFTLRSTAAIRR